MYVRVGYKKELQRTCPSSQPQPHACALTLPQLRFKTELQKLWKPFPASIFVSGSRFDTSAAVSVSRRCAQHF